MSLSSTRYFFFIRIGKSPSAQTKSTDPELIKSERLKNDEKCQIKYEPKQEPNQIGYNSRWYIDLGV